VSTHFAWTNWSLQATAKLAQFLLLASSVPPYFGAGRTKKVQAHLRHSGKASVKTAP